jgi:hypothetical protein
MTKCSFCNVEGHKITSCRNPRIQQVMSTVVNAGSSANLERVLNESTAADLSMVMVRYGIAGVGLSKSRKIELILNRYGRSVTREPATIEPATIDRDTPAPPLQNISPTVSLTPEQRSETLLIARRDRNRQLAKEACATIFAQANVLYGFVANQLMSMDECIRRYNEYRENVTLSVLRGVDAHANDYTMIYAEMSQLARNRSISIAHQVYEALMDFARVVRRSNIEESERVSLFHNKKTILERNAYLKNLLSPHEKDQMSIELERALGQFPIMLSSPASSTNNASSIPSAKSHLKPLCIAVTRSSTKIEEVLVRDGVEECLICMSTFCSKNATEVPVLMGCEHVCCSGCFITLATSRTKSFISCPFCRAEVAECMTPNSESMVLVSEKIKTA